MENKRILMIDKQVDESRKLKINLENLGAAVFISKTVEEGMLIINANNVDLIMVFDLEADFEKLKSSKISADIPVLAVLDEQQKGKINTSAEYLGDYIFRPYEKEQLYLRIKNQMKIKRLQDTIKDKELELEKVYKQLGDIKIVDEETGLYNSFYLKQILKNECASSKRYGFRLSGVAIDVDNKIENKEEYQNILNEMVKLLRKNIRQNDTLARLDSGEFYILLPHTGKKDASFVANKLRRVVAEHYFATNVQITISLGISSLDEIERGIRKDDEMIKHAKEALGRAKEKGGNKVEMF